MNSYITNDTRKMNSLTGITSDKIQSWNIDQVCAALVEAKKMEKIIEQLKQRVRNEVTPGITLTVSNGTVSVREPGITFTYREDLTPEDYLLPAIRPLNKARVRAHYDDTDGEVPAGVTSKISKSSVVVKSL